MGLFEKLFPKPKVIDNGNPSLFKLLNGYVPMFHSFGESVYESELVRSAIDARARHSSKLKIEFMGAANPTLNRSLKKAPNSWQTWAQFLYRTSTILDVRNTAFIVPVLNVAGETVGVYPIAPNTWELVQDRKGNPYLRFAFDDGNHSAMELQKVGILTKFQYKSDFFGSDNAALSSTMDLIEIQNQGIQEGVKSAASFRFMAQIDNFMSETDLAKERKRFSEQNLQTGGGFLLWPNTYKNIQQVDSKPFIVDANQMGLIKANVFEYYGVNEDILQNKAYGDAWAAFYEGAIEPFAIQLSEVLTKMLYTPKEQSTGNIVMATANRLQYMTTQEKLNVSSQLTDRGILNRDEVRDIWNLAPLPNGDGQEYIIRGEYWNATEKINEGGNNEQGS